MLQKNYQIFNDNFIELCQMKYYYRLKCDCVTLKDFITLIMILRSNMYNLLKSF